MHKSKQFRQTLIGTTVVGAFFGVLCALGSFAFYSEYGRHIAGTPQGAWESTLHAFATFLWVTVGIIVAFGLLPSAMSLAMSRLFRKKS